MREYKVHVQLTGTTWVTVEAEDIDEARVLATEHAEVGDVAGWHPEVLHARAS